MNNKEKPIIVPKFTSFKSNKTENVTDIVKHEKLTQIYKGPIVRGCYHGQGMMIWIEENQKQIYEGYFYVNRIHGYGRMTYTNGLIFEGLFKDNMRFGPGVVTHTNQLQEVGFWLGSHLLRLSCDLTSHVVPSYDVPNVSAKIKLLQFRHLIDLAQPPYSNLNIRDNNEKYLNKNYFFPYTRHLNSLFFDVHKFDPALISSSEVSAKDNIEKNQKNQFKCGLNLEDLIQKNYLVIKYSWFN